MLIAKYSNLSLVFGRNNVPVEEPLTKSDAFDLATIRDILNKRTMNKKASRKKKEYEDNRIFLHGQGKGPHNNRPDEVMEMFSIKIPKRQKEGSSITSVDRSTNKLNISGYLSREHSKSMVYPSLDNLEKKDNGKDEGKSLKKAASQYQKKTSFYKQHSSIIDNVIEQESIATFSEIPDNTHEPSQKPKSQVLLSNKPNSHAGNIHLPVNIKESLREEELEFLVSPIPKDFENTPKGEDGKDSMNSSLLNMIRSDSIKNDLDDSNKKVFDFKTQKSSGSDKLGNDNQIKSIEISKKYNSESPMKGKLVKKQEVQDNKGNLDRFSKDPKHSIGKNPNMIKNLSSPGVPMYKKSTSLITKEVSKTKPLLKK